MPKQSRKPTQPVRMTRRQVSRHQREQRQIRVVIAGAAVVLALIVLIPLFGVWQEVVAKGNQPYAVVAGETVTIGAYAKVLGFRQSVLQRQMQQVRGEFALLPTPTPTVAGAEPSPTAQPSPTGSTPATPADPRRAALERQFQQLSMESVRLEQSVQDELINDVFIRQELAQRGITLSAPEVDQAITTDRSLGATLVSLPQPTAITGTQPITPSAAQFPGPTLEEARRLVEESRFLTWDEFRRFVAEPRARRLRLQQAMAEAVPARTEQVRARHILLSTEDDAQKALARLQAGEDFAVLAKELSNDQGTKEQGGELGWFPRGVMDPAFEEAAFGMSAGELPKQAAHSAFGYHLIQVEEFAPQREVEPRYLDQIRRNALERWLTERKSPDNGLVSLQYTPDRQKWVQGELTKQR